MQYVRSADGTQIGYEKAGEGPPLIITGGALGDHRFYRALAAELAKGFRVYNLDRRGRGQSGDTQPYAVEREVEDIAALIADAGSPVFVYGHSAGSALVLRAAAARLDITKLVLADPPYSRHGDTEDAAKTRFAEAAATIRAFHEQGDHRGAAAFFLSGFGLPPEAVNEMLDSPGGEILAQQPVVAVDALVRTAGVPSRDVRRRLSAAVLEVRPRTLEGEHRFLPRLADTPEGGDRSNQSRAEHGQAPEPEPPGRAGWSEEASDSALSTHHAACRNHGCGTATGRQSTERFALSYRLASPR